MNCGSWARQTQDEGHLCPAVIHEYLGLEHFIQYSIGLKTTSPPASRLYSPTFLAAMKCPYLIILLITF